MKFIIDVFRNRYTIRNYTSKKAYKMEKSLSVWDKRYFRISSAYYIYNDDDMEIHLPSTISKTYLLNWLKGHEVQFIDRTNVVIDHIVDFKIELRDHISVREEQEQPVSFLMGEGDYHKFHNIADKMLNLRTGGGKTFCGIYSAIKFKKKTMFIAPNSTLFNQWIEKIGEYTKNGAKRTYKIKGAASVKKILKDDKLVSKYDFFVASSDTLSSMYKNGGARLIYKIFDKLNIGIKVFDESHMKSNALLKTHMFAPTLYTFFLTATPNKSSYLDKIAFKNAMSGLHTIGLESRKYSKHIHYRYIEYDSFPMDHQMGQCKTARGFSSIAYENYIVHSSDYKNQYFNMIYNEVFNLLRHYDVEDKIVVMFEKLETVELFYNILRERLDFTVPIGKYCGLVRAQDKDHEKKAKIILTTPGSFATGTDIEGLRAELYVPSYSSEVTSEQAPNRLRDYVLEKEENGEMVKYRKAVHYYEFIDIGFPDMVRQWKTRKRTHQKTAASINTKQIDIRKVGEAS